MGAGLVAGVAAAWLGAAAGLGEQPSSAHPHRIGAPTAASRRKTVERRIPDRLSPRRLRSPVRRRADATRPAVHRDLPAGAASSEAAAARRPLLPPGATPLPTTGTGDVLGTRADTAALGAGTIRSGAVPGSSPGPQLQTASGTLGVRTRAGALGACAGARSSGAGGVLDRRPGMPAPGPSSGPGRRRSEVPTVDPPGVQGPPLLPAGLLHPPAFEHTVTVDGFTLGPDPGAAPPAVPRGRGKGLDLRGIRCAPHRPRLDRVRGAGARTGGDALGNRRTVGSTDALRQSCGRGPRRSGGGRRGRGRRGRSATRRLARVRPSRRSARRAGWARCSRSRRAVSSFRRPRPVSPAAGARASRWR